MDLATVVFSSTTTEMISIKLMEPGHPRYVVRGTPLIADRPQRIQIVEAMAKDDSGWLRAAVDVSLPSLERLNPVAPPTA
jgi:hypothetical protein